jgi:glycerol-3-phosphate dehydrogenase (NAD(P)+)
MSKSSNVAVLGGGAFGVALAKLAAEQSDKVTLWARDEVGCQYINRYRHHPTKLPSIVLPKNIVASSDLAVALGDAHVVIIALPMAALTEVLVKARGLFAKDAIIVCTTKGIDEETLCLPCEIIEQTLPKDISLRSCYLSGPSFAIELAMGLPTALVLASQHQKSAKFCQRLLSSTHFRLYRSSDVIGVCVGGALKNVVAIAAGACAALDLGKNALASLITRGLSEMTRVAVAMGGKQATLSGLSGVGDLILSCTDDMSRNFRLGSLLAGGKNLEGAIATIGSVVEGAHTAKAIPRLCEKYNVELSIASAVFQVLYQGLSPAQAMALMLARRPEEEGGE